MNLYQEEILDHYKHPRNKKKLEKPTHYFEATNPLCGDTLRLGLLVEDGVIVDVGFQGEGCAISQAAMSMLTEDIISKPVSYANTITKEKVLEMLNVPVGPSRLKCALLCLQIVDSMRI